MDKKKLLETIKLVKENSKKRKFTQSFDLIINLKELNLKKPEENVDLSLVLPNDIEKKVKICALVDKSLADQAKVFDKVIQKDEFKQYKNKKEIKKLADEYDYFIAQGNLMTDVAKAFGKTFGPKGKMPNPKTGGIVNPSSDLEALNKKLQNTVFLKTKNESSVKVKVGTEKTEDEKLSDNILAVYNAIIHVLPQEESNVQEVMLKLTMGPSVKLGSKKEDIPVKEKPKKKKEAPVKEKPKKKEK